MPRSRRRESLVVVADVSGSCRDPETFRFFCDSYPLFLIGTAAVILLFFLIYVVPQFEPVFKDLGGRLNSGAALIVAASIWLRANVDLFLGGCLALVLGAWLGLSRREWRVRVVAAIARLPGIPVRWVTDVPRV